MSWAYAFDDNWQRDIGYGVPAFCDHPGCGAEIDRGLAYVCGGEPYGGDDGCGLFFCDRHRQGYPRERCERCYQHARAFEPTPDHPKWMRHKLTHGSWESWRAEHPAEVEKIRQALRAGVPASLPSNETSLLR